MEEVVEGVRSERSPKWASLSFHGHLDVKPLGSKGRIIYQSMIHAAPIIHCPLVLVVSLIDPPVVYG